MDNVDKTTRSLIMSKIRSKGNHSTERRLRSALMRAGIKGWRIHTKTVKGTPDFYFPGDALAVFVDGCFWHGCPSCYRRPHSRRKYWDSKLARNIERDRRVDEALRLLGTSVLRVWEHEILGNIPDVLNRIESVLNQKSHALI